MKEPGKATWWKPYLRRALAAVLVQHLCVGVVVISFDKGLTILSSLHGKGQLRCLYSSTEPSIPTWIEPALLALFVFHCRSGTGFSVLWELGLELNGKHKVHCNFSKTPLQDGPNTTPKVNQDPVEYSCNKWDSFSWTLTGWRVGCGET